MQFQECLSKASGEGRGGLCNTTLCTCQLCGKSGKEVILCLFRCQNRYRRKYAECICGKDDYVLCSRCGRNRTYNVLNVVDGIRNTGVLGYALIIEVNLSFCINGNIL